MMSDDYKCLQSVEIGGRLAHRDHASGALIFTVDETICALTKRLDAVEKQLNQLLEREKP